ncbi:septum site-determining protein MinC [Solimonas sp. K1W22B-7]|uniref:septum site-determining protein MinC n=1 Tax=Solimonas sp. K1W22B-7 TaxID=2303331 RepID=UPI000E336D5B|nr:septum site-determining protein MinC [Solimonas sp. K1W22B-7]AXQ28239.1 septum site-determining protein MinC [Solimonas sp. K1W22B-7]
MTSTKALEFKGRMLSVSRLRVLVHDPLTVEEQIRDFAKSMPPAMQGMPVVIESDQALELGGILSALRTAGLQPLGVSDGPLNESARNWGLAVLPPEGRGARPAPAPRAEVAAAEAPAPAPAPAAAAPAPAPAPAPAAAPAAQRAPTRIVTEPVRSGQQIYAAGADLVAMNIVGAGAEVVADGCIHVYGAARGRVIAGASGDIQARIFCRRFEAELVAIAGVYAVADQMAGDLRGKPVQAWLADGKLKLERLDW